MVEKILITRPKSDDATYHTYYWAGSIMKEAEELGYDIIDYQKGNVTYENVSKALRLHNPNLYIHFGHGCVASLIGQTKCIVTNGSNNFDISNLNYLQKYTHRMGNDIQCDSVCGLPSNVELLSNKIIIAYSCHSAKRLGKCAMNNGAKAYIGFDDYLIFMVDTKKTEQIFTNCLFTFTYSLLNGDTIKMAKEKTLQKFDYYVKLYKNVKYLAMLLLWDRMAFKVYGDENLTIFN